MTKGTVKWFNNAKGYGFIVPGNGGGDVFAHYSTIEMEGYKTLRAGQLVQFEAVEGPNGMQTSLVKALEQSNDGNAYP
jgi:CspA family cold shock protein